MKSKVHKDTESKNSFDSNLLVKNNKKTNSKTDKKNKDNLPSFIKISKLKKSYGSGSNYVQILHGIDCQIGKSEIVVILGPSGSGKSTLMNIIGGIDSFDSGNLIVGNYDMSKIKEKELANYRRDFIGFIFQLYNLVPNLTVKENITLCTRLTKNPLDVYELLDVLGLTEHKNKYPSQLSGGQQQRCAIARALIKNSKLLLCDEPTGALDSKSAKEILILLESVNKKYGTTVLIITHNGDIKNMANRVIKIRDGLIKENYVNDKPIPAAEIEL